MGRLYLRDLNRDLQETVKAEIRESRPRLKKAMENGEDIEIGTIHQWDVKRYKKA